MHLRVLCWSTWAHVIGHTNNLGAAMVLTADCYVFALPPAGGANVNAAARYLDVCGQLLETVITKQPTAFVGQAIQDATKRLTMSRGGLGFTQIAFILDAANGVVLWTMCLTRAGTPAALFTLGAARGVTWADAAADGRGG
ncbi:hypothetical protein HYPSUDRAFT_202601 [Hypholoma sublateritium FD-334 SS-4]|uniref:Roadblock/LAMTOR2 domain-containing protein n=1 Tax=Hypholoma sublateritium (strain FD-334 SS-4) TaxID=945553 RepID=A0A0D2PPS3_HYPSF|nr:hypothetical protein HYPSUDRAFT_202601 [Hypholoma sublateritium FD-334 SS-4]